MLHWATGANSKAAGNMHARLRTWHSSNAPALSLAKTFVPTLQVPRLTPGHLLLVRVGWGGGYSASWESNSSPSSPNVGPGPKPPGEDEGDGMGYNYSTAGCSTCSMNHARGYAPGRLPSLAKLSRRQGSACSALQHPIYFICRYPMHGK